MTAGARRVFLYWLLLLLPTLAAGGGALWLLKREQAHLDEQARAAAESGRASIEARARLIAENVELLVGDVQNALMTTLQQTPTASASSSETFLEEWERTTPIVRGVFRLTPDGQIARPSADSPRVGMRVWLRAWLLSGAPWRSAGGSPQMAESDVDRQARRDVASNVQNVQSARSAIQDVAGFKTRVEKNQEMQTVERTGWTPWRDGGGLHLVGWRLLPSGTVFGVEVELAEIVRRLGDLLPKEGDQAEAFTLREAGGATLQSKVYRPVTSASDSRVKPADVTVPISAAVLPGWEVAGFARNESGSVSAGAGFFIAGAVLVAIFMMTILSGGSLLLWQARRSEAEAAQKTSFVANVSHEFKTPLTTIRLYSELLEQGRVRDVAQKDEYLRIIGLETERLARLVNNALDFSRLEQGRKKYARDRIDLVAELTRLLETHEPRLAEAGLILERVLPDRPVEVTGDRDAIEQIVLNLLDNACKYAAAGKEITVSLARSPSGSGRGAEVRVADRGPGVPVDHRQRIFEKFHRVDETLTADKGGAGLGLSIARQLARGMGGELRFEARPGGGAEFILTLGKTPEG